jgi:hypothetical protein
MFRYKRAALLALPALLLVNLCSAQDAAVVTSEASPDTAAVFEARMALRDLWVEHIFWIRSYVLATQTGDQAQRIVAENQVLANAKTLAGTIAPFYGRDAADGLLALLAVHWGAVRDFNTATVRHSEEGRSEAVQDLTTNAHEIAKFLSGANPYLPEDAVFGLFAAHGAHHVAQIDQIAAGDYQQEAETWAAMRAHMLVIANSIAAALARQFPDRFAR